MPAWKRKMWQIRTCEKYNNSRKDTAMAKCMLTLPITFREFR